MIDPGPTGAHDGAQRAAGAVRLDLGAAVEAGAVELHGHAGLCESAGCAEALVNARCIAAITVPAAAPHVLWALAARMDGARAFALSAREIRKVAEEIAGGGQ